MFHIELQKIHWLESYNDEDNLDLCAHGKVRVTIGNEIVADNSSDPDDWWSLTAMALHLLRTLEFNHTSENKVGQCLVPSEGHHINHLPDEPMVLIETVYPIERGVNWWVIHQDKQVRLITEANLETVIPFEGYKNQILQFVDKVQTFYEVSKPKTLPEEKYDREAYLKLWKEWNGMRTKWK